MTMGIKYLELIAAEKAYVGGVQAVVDLIETEARKVLALRPEIESIIDCQGLSRIKLHNGRELSFDVFPRLRAALDLWEDHNRFECGVVVRRINGDIVSS
jgi:hypothetical protein